MLSQQPLSPMPGALSYPFIPLPNSSLRWIGAKERKIKKLYAYTYDRITRDPLDMLNIMRICSENDVILEFVEGPSDTSDEGQLLMFILGYAAKRERLQFIERSQRGREQAARQGRMPVGTGCGIYGCNYVAELKRRVINEKEAAVVRMMFQMAADGVSRYHIACALNEANIPSKLGKKWTINAVDRTLKNRAYTGYQYYGLRQQRRINGKNVQIGWRTEDEAIPIENFTPQIISPELFNAVQERLVVQQARRKKKGTRYLLTGFIWCGKCGCRMVASMYAGGQSYYRCRNAIHTVGREVTCDARHVRGDKLDPLVWKIVRDVIADPAVISHEIRLNAETGDGDIGEKMKELRKVISDCKNQESRLLDPYLEGVIDVDVLKAKSGPLKALREEKEGQLRILEEQQKSKDAVAAAEKRIAEYCERFQKGLDHLDIESKRATLAAFGVRVEATHEDVSITVTVDPAATTMSPSSRAKSIKKALSRTNLKAAVLQRDGNKCAYCGKYGKRNKLEMEHVVPRSTGGSDRYDNRVASCKDCNAKKNNRPLEEFLKRRPKKLQEIHQKMGMDLADPTHMNMILPRLLSDLKKQGWTVVEHAAATTAAGRITCGIEKSHHGTPPSPATPPDSPACPQNQSK